MNNLILLFAGFAPCREYIINIVVMLARYRNIWGLSKRLLFSVAFMSSGNLINTQSQNLFYFKSFRDIEKTFATNTYKKNTKCMSVMILDAITKRIIEAKNPDLSMSAQEFETAARIIDQCMCKIEPQMNDLTLSEILVMVEFISCINFIKNSRMKEKYRNIYTELLHLVERRLTVIEPSEENIELVTKILLNVLVNYRILPIFQKIIDFLAAKSLKNNAEIIRLLEKLGSIMRKFSDNDYSLNVILKRLIFNPKNNESNINEWFNPTVFNLLFMNADRIIMNNHSVYHLCMKNIELMVDKNLASLEDRILYLKTLMEFPFVNSNQNIKVDEAKYNCRITLKLINSIIESLQRDKTVDFRAIRKYVNIAEKVQGLAMTLSTHLGSFFKESTQQLQLIYELCIRYGYLPAYEQSIKVQREYLKINNDAKIPRDLQVQIARLIISVLNRQIDEKNFLFKIKRMSYVVKVILDFDLQEERKQFIAYLKRVEKTLINQKSYEIFKLYNLFRVLGEQSELLERFVDEIKADHKMIIENLNKSVLVSYNEPEIFRHCKQITKDNNLQNFLKGFWYSFHLKSHHKKIISKIYNFWMIQNQQFVKDTLSNIEYVEVLARILYSSFFSNQFYPIQLQVLIDTFKIVLESHKNTQKYQRANSFVFGNLRAFICFKNFAEAISNNKGERNQLFVKSLWLLNFIQQRQLMFFSKLKFRYQFNHLYQIIQKQQIKLHREAKQNFRLGMIRRNISFINFSKMIEERRQNYIINIVYWLQYQSIECSHNINEESLHGYKELIEQQMGLARTLEIILQFYKKSPQMMEAQFESYRLRGAIPHFLFEGTQDVVASTSDLLDILPLKNTLSQVFKRNPDKFRSIVKSLTGMFEYIPKFKLIEAVNLVECFVELLSAQQQKEFKEWVSYHLLGMERKFTGDYEQYMTFLEFNYVSARLKPLFDEFISNELKENNFNIFNLLYLNGYECSDEQLESLFSTYNSSRIYEYLKQHYILEHLGMMKSILGLCLNQPNTQHLRRFVSETLNAVNFANFKKQSNQMVDFLILLNVAARRLQGETEYVAEINKIMEKICDFRDREDSLLFSVLKQRNEALLKKLKMSYSVQNPHKFPMIQNEYILVDNSKPGLNKLIREYLEARLEATNIRILSDNIMPPQHQAAIF